MPHAVLITNTGWSMWRHRGEQIRELVARGCKVSAIALYQGDEAAELERLGAVPYNLSCAASGANVYKNLKYFLKLTRLVRRLKPDVVHGFSIQAGVWGSLAARLLRVRSIVCTVTGSGYLVSGQSRFIQQAVIALARLALRGRVAVIFQNKEGIEDFVREGIVKREQCVYIPGCGVDIDSLTPASVRACATFVMISRMLWSKGVKPFVDAAEIVRKQHPGAVFFLVGGCKEDYAEQNSDFVPMTWLQDATKNHNVKWLGRVPPAEAERIMSQATAVVLLSSYGEGVPRVLIEAAALGAPIITTDTPGCRDVVEDGVSGFLCDSPEQAALAMVSLIQEPGLVKAMGAEGRKLAKAFDIRAIMEKTLEAYGNALSHAEMSAEPPGRANNTRDFRCFPDSDSSTRYADGRDLTLD